MLRRVSVPVPVPVAMPVARFALTALLAVLKKLALK
jgi:hypothetical protein